MENLTEKRSIRCLDSFTLKILAVIFMTLDHIAMFFINPASMAYKIIRIIGRLTFPIFGFLIIESFFKTSNRWKFAGRLLIIGVIMDVATVIFDPKNYVGNTLITFGLVVVILTLLEMKNWYSLLALPIMSLFILQCFDFFPIKIEYGFFGLLLLMTFYGVYKGVDYYLENMAAKTNQDLDVIKIMYERKFKNLFCALALLLVNLVFYLIFRLDNNSPLLLPMFDISQWSILAAVFIILYNGKRGFNNRYMNDAFYLYYPLHLLVLWLIFFFITK